MNAKKIILSASAAAMALAPVAASAAPAASVSVERSSKSAKKSSELGGTGLVIAIFAGLAVIGGIIAAASDDDTPVSV